MNNPITVVYGGTFNPVHSAHVLNIQKACLLLNPGRLLVLPCYQPVHKDSASISIQHRLAMLRLALKELPPSIQALCEIDTREVDTGEPRYSVDTLKDYRQELGDQVPLVFLVGSDSLVNITSWSRWQELSLLINLLVIARPGFEYKQMTEDGQHWFQQHRTKAVTDLNHYPSGKIYLFKDEQVQVASSEIRSNPQEYAKLLPESVQNYIRENRLYFNAE